MDPTPESTEAGAPATARTMADPGLRGAKVALLLSAAGTRSAGTTPPVTETSDQVAFAMKTSLASRETAYTVTEVPAAMLCAGTTMCMGDIKIVTQSKGNCHGSRPPSGVNGSAQATSCGRRCPEKDTRCNWILKSQDATCVGFQQFWLASRHLGCAQRLPRHRARRSRTSMCWTTTSKRSFRVVHSIFCLGDSASRWTRARVLSGPAGRDTTAPAACRFSTLRRRRGSYRESVWWLVSGQRRSQEREACEPRVARGS